MKKFALYLGGTNEASLSTSSFPLKMGSRGDNVKKWQTYLNGKGADLVVDGVWGPKTEAASLKYQQLNSISEYYFNRVVK